MQLFVFHFSWINYYYYYDMFMKLMIFYELVNSNIEMQMSLCNVNNDFSVINI